MKNKLNRHALGLLGLLVVQYILGMITDLYVTFPSNNTDYQQWEYAKSQFVVMAHIIVGFLILFGVIALMVRAMRTQVKAWKTPSIIAVVAVILTIMSGSEFISTQTDLYSLIMAILFVVIAGSIVWGLYRSRA